MSGTMVRVECLLGRRVRARNGHPVGRIEELRVEKRGAEHVVVGYALGESGWLERMGLPWRGGSGARRTGRLARWDQLDLSDPDRPRLTCAVSDLAPLEPEPEPGPA